MNTKTQTHTPELLDVLEKSLASMEYVRKSMSLDRKDHDEYLVISEAIKQARTAILRAEQGAPKASLINQTCNGCDELAKHCGPLHEVTGYCSECQKEVDGTYRAEGSK